MAIQPLVDVGDELRGSTHDAATISAHVQGGIFNGCLSVSSYSLRFLAKTREQLAICEPRFWLLVPLGCGPNLRIRINIYRNTAKHRDTMLAEKYVRNDRPYSICVMVGSELGGNVG